MHLPRTKMSTHSNEIEDLLADAFGQLPDDSAISRLTHDRPSETPVNITHTLVRPRDVTHGRISSGWSMINLDEKGMELTSRVSKGSDFVLSPAVSAHSMSDGKVLPMAINICLSSFRKVACT